MTTHVPVKSRLPFGSTATTGLSMRRVNVPCDPVTSRTIWITPGLPANLTDGSTSVPESLIPPEADHVPVNGPMMTVLWTVTGTEVLAIAGVAAVPSNSSTGARHTPMNDSRRMAPPFGHPASLGSRSRTTNTGPSTIINPHTLAGPYNKPPISVAGSQPMLGDISGLHPSS